MTTGKSQAYQHVEEQPEDVAIGVSGCLLKDHNQILYCPCTNELTLSLLLSLVNLTMSFWDAWAKYCKKNHIIFSHSVFSESVCLTVHRIILVGNYPICRNHHYIDIRRTYRIFQRQVDPLHAQSLHLLDKRHRWTLKNVMDNDKMEKVCFKSSNIQILKSNPKHISSPTWKQNAEWSPNPTVQIHEWNLHHLP